ncbi:MAG: DUF1232 domain-containing protein [Thermoleophilia bacterium]|nr:DUF1232 domain-containing protein [Thermoleophilia bacterium]
MGHGGWKLRVAALKRELHALGIAYRDPRTPRAARVVTAIVLAYALSPIDLIPDFIPVVGYLDDLILVPVGIIWALRLIPPEVMVDARQRATDAPLRLGRWGAVAVIATWLLLAAVSITAWRAWR